MMEFDEKFEETVRRIVREEICAALKGLKLELVEVTKQFLPYSYHHLVLKLGGELIQRMELGREDYNGSGCETRFASSRIVEHEDQI